MRNRIVSRRLSAAALLGFAPMLAHSQEAFPPSRALGAEIAAGIGAASGDLTLSGIYPPRGNTYEIKTPLDGMVWGVRGMVRADRLRLRAAYSSLNADDGDLTDKDRDPSGDLWSFSRSNADNRASQWEARAGWEALAKASETGWGYSLEGGLGYVRQQIDVTATNKRFELPAQGPAPGVFLGEHPGTFLDDSIKTDGFLLYLRGNVTHPVGGFRLAGELEGRFLPGLDTEFREVRYPDRPEITVRRGIDLSGDGWAVEAAVRIEPKIPYRASRWFVRLGYRWMSYETTGNDLDWSYIDPAMENTLEVDQGTVFLDGGARF